MALYLYHGSPTPRSRSPLRSRNPQDRLEIVSKQIADAVGQILSGGLLVR